MAISEETKAILEAQNKMIEVLTNRLNPALQMQIKQSMQEMQEIMFPLAPANKLPVRVPCVHPNGYKFTAVVAPSDTYQGGRWVGVEDEQWPTDAELCATIDWWHKRKRFIDASRPDLGYDKDTQLWLYDNIRLPILRSVGKELPIDWREDMQEKVRALRAQAATEMARLQEQLRTLQLQPKEPDETAPAKPAKTPRVAAAPAIDAAK